MRIEKLRESLKEKNIDAALITSVENVRYYSEFTGDSSELLITNSELFLFTDFRYTEHAQRETCFDVVETKGQDRVETIFNYASRSSAVKVGADLANVKYPEYKSYLEHIDEQNFLDITADISAQRLVKDEDELSAIRKGAEYNDLLFEHLCSIIKQGMSEKEIKAEIIYFMLKSGAQVAFDPIVASGENSSLPHAVPSDRTFRPGDFITMDYGFKFDGYCSDFTRTVAICEVDKEQQKVYDIVNEAAEQALPLLSPGAECAKVDTAARDYITQHGYGQYFGHGLGHGVGMDIHEAPTLNGLSKDVLQAGMTVTIEPGIYIAGKYGVRIEDLCVITEDGFENLTAAPRELIIL